MLKTVFQNLYSIAIATATTAAATTTTTTTTIMSFLLVLGH
jgi:hypothetical protein